MHVKRFTPLVLFLLFLSGISGYLMSKASLAGRIGIGLFYKEYRFLKVWWQGALAVLAVLMAVLLLQALLEKKLGRQKTKALAAAMALLAFIGFYFTWQDFHHTNTHRILGGRFHLGAYLFWLGWLVISGFFLFTRSNEIGHYEEERRHIDV